MWEHSFSERLAVVSSWWNTLLRELPNEVCGIDIIGEKPSSLKLVLMSFDPLKLLQALSFVTISRISEWSLIWSQTSFLKIRWYASQPNLSNSLKPLLTISWYNGSSSYDWTLGYAGGLSDSPHHSASDLADTIVRSDNVPLSIKSWYPLLLTR